MWTLSELHVRSKDLNLRHSSKELHEALHVSFLVYSTVSLHVRSGISSSFRVNSILLDFRMLIYNELENICQPKRQ